MTWALKTQGLVTMLSAELSLIAHVCSSHRLQISQLLHHALQLSREDFIAQYSSVWPDNLAEAALGACVQFLKNFDLLQEFHRRWRALQMRNLLLRRRENVRAPYLQRTLNVFTAFLSLYMIAFAL
jgi:hypothetical protein